MTKAERYLKQLEHEKDIWQEKVDNLPGDTIVTNHPFYKMCNNAAARYAAAAYMMKLMQESN